MTAWAGFYPWVLPHVRGCPQPLLDQALRDAAREFCNRSRAWIEQATAVTPSGTTSLFSFVFPTGGELVRVERATVGGEDYKVMNSSELPADYLQASPSNDLSETLVVVSKTQYRVFERPASTDSIVIYQSLRPTVAATSVGDVIYEQWAEALAHGARARLLAMPAAAWFNADGSMLAKAAFEEGVHDAANWKFRQNRRLRTRKSPL